MLVSAFDYKQWSDRRTLAAMARIDRAAFPEAAAFTAQQLNHMVIVEELFRARLAGTLAPHRATNTDTVPDLQELAQRLAASNEWFSCQARDLTPAQRQQRLSFTFADGRQGCMSRQEILFHIINHGTYHRGAIGHALDLARVAHPADTYTVFIHEAEPARRG